jgi:leucyl/phenylalanyl-tRNA--protein transferase
MLAQVCTRRGVPDPGSHMIPRLERDTPFPPLSSALKHPNGLLAAGGDLSPRRLLEGYRRGIFPWFTEGDPILWWSPDPRMVLFLAEFKISRSLGKTLRNRRYEVRFDSAFARVVAGCAASRKGESGTWIGEAMMAAYLELHRLGYAHSVETWIDGDLAGGLYGVAIGRMFFGESMFSLVRDASKIALAALVAHLKSAGFGLIDCQMHTRHLETLGAREIPRARFSRLLEELVHYTSSPGTWSGASFAQVQCPS